MFRKMTFAIFISLFFSIVAQAQEIRQLTEKLQVTFPLKPVKTETGPEVAYMLRLADSTANFSSVVIDLEKASGITAEVLSMAMLDPGFWDQVEKGMMGQFGNDAKVIARQQKKIGELEGREVVIEKANPSGGISRITVLVIIDGKFSVTALHNNRTGRADEAMKDKFFASLSAR